MAEICRPSVGAWVFKCQTPLVNTGQKSTGAQRGGAVEDILLPYQRFHGPLIVCLSFRPGEHVMSPLERVCFFFLSTSWQQGALTHLIWTCTAVWCQADCPLFFVHVCTRSHVRVDFSFKAHSELYWCLIYEGTKFYVIRCKKQYKY